MAARANEAIEQYDAGISSAQAITLDDDVPLNRITRGVFIGGAATCRFSLPATLTPISPF